MIIINKRLDRMSFEDIVKKNSVKSAKKLEKIQKQQEMMNAYASMNTRNIASRANMNTGGKSASSSKDVSDKKIPNVEYSSKSKPGSIAAKANMVKEYNEKNNK